MAFAGVRKGIVMSVREIDRFLEQWQMGVKDLRRRMILAPTPWERAFFKLRRWHAILLVAQGLTAAATAEELEPAPTPSDGGRQPSAREGLRP